MLAVPVWTWCRRGCCTGGAAGCGRGAAGASEAGGGEAEGGGVQHCCQVWGCHGLAWLAWGLGFRQCHGCTAVSTLLLGAPMLYLASELLHGWAVCLNYLPVATVQTSCCHLLLGCRLGATDLVRREAEREFEELQLQLQAQRLRTALTEAQVGTRLVGCLAGAAGACSNAMPPCCSECLLETWLPVPAGERRRSRGESGGAAVCGSAGGGGRAAAQLHAAGGRTCGGCLPTSLTTIAVSASPPSRALGSRPLLPACLAAIPPPAPADPLRLHCRRRRSCR